MKKVLAVFKNFKHLKYLPCREYGDGRRPGPLQELHDLVCLNLHDNELVTDGGLAHFKGCTKLATLDVKQRDPGRRCRDSHFRDCKGLQDFIRLWRQGERRGAAFPRGLHEFANRPPEWRDGDRPPASPGSKTGKI